MKILIILAIATQSLWAINLVEERVTKDEIYMKASNGAIFQMTRTDIKAHYQAETGNAATRKANTIAWIKTQIANALGEMIDISKVIADFDTVDDTKPMSLDVND